jgi:hypothetical protein
MAMMGISKSFQKHSSNPLNESSNHNPLENAKTREEAPEA